MKESTAFFLNFLFTFILGLAFKLEIEQVFMINVLVGIHIIIKTLEKTRK